MYVHVCVLCMCVLYIVRYSHHNTAVVRDRYTKQLRSVPVAVRSSATTEDTAEASFAGQHDTFLNQVCCGVFALCVCVYCAVCCCLLSACVCVCYVLRVCVFRAC